MIVGLSFTLDQLSFEERVSVGTFASLFVKNQSQSIDKQLGLLFEDLNSLKKNPLSLSLNLSLHGLILRLAHLSNA